MAIPSGEEPAEASSEASMVAADDAGQLIPGLPDEVAEYCLLRLPFPYSSLARSVSSSWKRAISSPAFPLAKKTLSLSLPYLFVFSFHRSTLQLQWHAFDPRARRWFSLPPMPLGAGAPLCPPAFACVAVPRRGELFVLGGMRSDTQAPLQTLLSYRAATNSWAVAAPMPTPRSFSVAGCIDGKIFALGGYASGDDATRTVECYDPASDQWATAAGMRWGMTRYDAAVVGGRLYVTEGWTWPFSFSPRGGVYDPGADSWEDMASGMKEGWTGASVVLGGRLFVVSEYGDFRLKVYDEVRDSWECVGGGGVPMDVQRPFTVAGVEGRIYVVSCGLTIGVGTLSHGDDGGKKAAGWWVEWEVVKGEEEFADLAPCNSLVLYA
ncbi:hypothetical protein Taro_017017 [Colocasia esculenta]|uniref:F-box domain-containing protein n=1 Tax=Colocasia esculenta TaxID=4460 RepID=A0A843UQ43_COLES|nr:hypothetical protein [Colocasia esculenta]